MKKEKKRKGEKPYKVHYYQVFAPKRQKTKIMISGPITSWQIDGETMETVTDFIFLVSKITVDGD